MSLIFEKILAEAEKGEVDSQYKLASMYQFGNGTPIDLEEAIKWYEKAADRGHMAAHNAIIILKNPNENFFYESSNEKINRERQERQESEYREETEREEEIEREDEREREEESEREEERERLHKAAENGDLSAQSDLATDYYIDQEPAEAFKWALLASKQGDASSQHTLGDLYRQGFSEQTADIKEAVKWLTKSAIQGYEMAQGELFEIYYNGDRVPKDYEKAFKWIKEIAKNNKHESGAQYQVAMMYEKGEGVSRDYKQMVKWLIKAAKNTSTQAQLHLGIIYYHGDRGLLKDYKEAVKWFTKAAEAKDTPFENFNTWAQEKLAGMYYHGEGVSTNYKKAEKYYRKAAEEGNTHAQYLLYKNAKKMNIDTKESLDWLEKSAGIGQSHSKKVEMTVYSKPIEPPYADAQYLLGTTLYKENNSIDRSISKYLIKKAYKNSDKNISKKAEEFWNKNELWCEKDYEYRYKDNDEQSDEQLLKEIIIAATYLTLGKNFLNGSYVLKDPILAIKYFKKEFDEGSIDSKKDAHKYEAAFELGVIYTEENTVKDYTKSKKWIKIAHECSNTEINKKAEDFWNKHELWKH